MAHVHAPFPYHPPPGLHTPEPRHPVVIVGAGPVGLTLAIDLAQRGVASVVLDDNDVVSVGSRAICWSKRSLEIFGRLGLGEVRIFISVEITKSPDVRTFRPFSNKSPESTK